VLLLLRRLPGTLLAEECPPRGEHLLERRALLLGADDPRDLLLLEFEVGEGRAGAVGIEEARALIAPALDVRLEALFERDRLLELGNLRVERGERGLRLAVGTALGGYLDGGARLAEAERLQRLRRGSPSGRAARST